VHRIVQAELWGFVALVVKDADLTVRRIVGEHGSLWEIETRSLWRVWRMHAVIARYVPSGATLRLWEDIDPDDWSDGVFLIHFWEDTPNHAIIDGAEPPTQISKPAQHLQLMRA